MGCIGCQVASENHNSLEFKRKKAEIKDKEDDEEELRKRRKREELKDRRSD